MSLQDSGIIKISDLVTEFGGSTPRKLTNYYRGGSLVENSTNNANVPTSGRIKLTDFYNAGTPSINVLSQVEIGGGTQFFYNNATINTQAAQLGSQTKLVIVYCSRSDSHTNSSDSAADTTSGTCTITGKTTTQVKSSGINFSVGSRDGSTDPFSAASVQFICNLGNESSFNITLDRSNSSGTFVGSGPALAMIIQIDSVSFTSPFRSTSTNDSVKDFSKTLNPVANKGFTVFATAVLPFNASNVGTPKANGSAMDTTLINSGSPANRCAIAVQNETTGGSVAYTLDGSGINDAGFTATTICNYAF